MSLDFTPLQSAIHQLEKSLRYAHSPIAENHDLFEQLRNSVIHCFEFTYELSHKMLKRYLEETAASPEENDLSTFQNLIRTGNQKGLDNIPCITKGMELVPAASGGYTSLSTFDSEN